MDYEIRREFLRITSNAANNIQWTIEDELQKVLPRYKKEIASVCKDITQKQYNFIEPLSNKYIYQNMKSYLKRYIRNLNNTLHDIALYLANVAENEPENLKLAEKDMIKELVDINYIDKYNIIVTIPEFERPFIRKVIDTYKSILTSSEEKIISQVLYDTIHTTIEQDIVDMLNRIKDKINKFIKQLEGNINKTVSYIYEQSNNKDYKLLNKYNESLKTLNYSIDQKYDGLVIKDSHGKEYKAYVDGKQIRTDTGKITVSSEKDLLVLYNAEAYYKFITINNHSVSLRSNNIIIDINRIDENFQITWNKKPITDPISQLLVLNYINDFYPGIIDELSKSPKYVEHLNRCKKVYEGNLLFKKDGKFNPVKYKEIKRKMALLGFVFKEENGVMLAMDKKGVKHEIIVNNQLLSFKDDQSVKINLQKTFFDTTIEFNEIYMETNDYILMSNSKYTKFRLYLSNDNKCYQIEFKDNTIVGTIYSGDNESNDDGEVLELFNSLFPNVTFYLTTKIIKKTENELIEEEIHSLEDTPEVKRYLELIKLKAENKKEKQKKETK